jgi:hypothetical protein
MKAVRTEIAANRTSPTIARELNPDALRYLKLRASPSYHSLPGSSRFVVNDPAVAGIHATVLAALANRIRVR